MNDQEFLEAKVGGLEATLQALQQTHWDNYFAAAIAGGHEPEEAADIADQAMVIRGDRMGKQKGGA